MSAAQHTPGPWKATRSNPADGADIWWITACPAPNMETEITGIHGGYPHDLREANARLVAAAPEMLAALEATERAEAAHAAKEDYAGWVRLDAEAHRLRSAAIAKARGA